MTTGAEKFLIAPATMMDTRFASVKATSEVASMPASNLLRPHPADWWVAPVVTGLEVTFELDLEAGEEWGLVAPLYTNLGPNCTWRVQAAATEAGLASPTFQTNPVAGQNSADLASRSHEWVHAWVWTGSSEWLAQGKRSEKWVRIQITTVDPKLPIGYTGNPYVQWGNVLIADPWQPPYHVDRGSRQRRDEQARKSRTLAGGERVAPRRRPRKASYTIGFLTRAESLAFVDEIDRRVGSSVPVLTIFDPLDLANAYREAIYGTLSVSDRTHVDTDIYTKAVEIAEAYA
jgi:hypothetical protein